MARSLTGAHRSGRWVYPSLILILFLALHSISLIPTVLAREAAARQFIAMADDAEGLFSNPAGLIWLTKRSLGMQLWAPDASSQGTIGFSEGIITYAEPDSGLGAGALSLYASPMATQYVYTVARRMGASSAAGVNLKYDSTEVGSWWTLDIGYNYAPRNDVSFAVAVQNAVGSRGRSPGGGSLPRKSPGFQGGLALGNQEGFFIAGDYLDEDLNSSGDEPVYGLIGGFEIGAATLWGGQRTAPRIGERYRLFGVEVRFPSLELGWNLYETNAGGRSFAIAVAHRF